MPRLGKGYDGELLRSMEFYAVEIRSDLGDVVGGSANDLGVFACTEGHAHRVLVGLFEFGLDEQAGCVELGHPASGFVVAIDGVV